MNDINKTVRLFELHDTDGNNLQAFDSYHYRHLLSAVTHLSSLSDTHFEETNQHGELHASTVPLPRWRTSVSYSL